MVDAYCQTARPLSLTQRLLWRLFPGATAPLVPAAEKLTYLTVETHVHLDWKDRVRILLTGHGVTISRVFTDVEVKTARTVANFGVAR